MIHFFDLPPEIRNYIYKLVFPCGSHTAYNPVLHYRNIEPCKCFGQNLMLVSHQMRDEAVSLHYSTHEFHFVLFPPNLSILEGWVKDMAKLSVSHIRRFQLKRYITTDEMIYRERMLSITVDLSGEQAVTETWLAGKQFDFTTELMRIVKELPYVDGRPALTPKKLFEMFDVVGWR